MSNTLDNRLNFGVRKKYESDIVLPRSSSRARPGFQFNFGLSAFNKGNIAGDVIVKILPDPILSLEESNEDYQSGDTLIWEITELEPNTHFPITLQNKSSC